MCDIILYGKDRNDIPMLYQYEGFRNAVEYDVNHPRHDILATLAKKRRLYRRYSRGDVTTAPCRLLSGLGVRVSGQVCWTGINADQLTQVKPYR